MTVCVTLSWHIGKSCELLMKHGGAWGLRRDVNVDDSWGTRVDSLAPLWFSDRFHRTWVSYTYILVFIESRTHAARHTKISRFDTLIPLFQKKSATFSKVKHGKELPSITKITKFATAAQADTYIHAINSSEYRIPIKWLFSPRLHKGI